jgi:hypothetical protein
MLKIHCNGWYEAMPSCYTLALCGLPFAGAFLLRRDVYSGLCAYRSTSLARMTGSG